MHLPPDGSCTGGIVLVPPLGYEQVVAHRTIRVLAQRLSDRGQVVLRYDHAGTGDSSGWFRDAGLVADWVAGVGDAVDVLRAASAPSIGVVGMRAGALFAASAVEGGTAVDHLVLWDPVASGSSLVREWRVLRDLVPADPSAPGEQPDIAASTPEDFEVAGARYRPDTLEVLRGLTVERPIAAPTLALTRPDRPSRAVRRWLGPWSEVRWEEAVGQDLLLDGESSTAIVPHEAIGTIADWVAARAVGPPRSVDVPEAAGVQEVTGPSGQVWERPLSLGPAGLFAMVTAPDPDADGPVAIGLNNAADYHIGPARMWVDWGRALAAQGWTVVRMDIPGVGDSPSPPGYEDDHAYPQHGVEDIAAALNAAGLGDGALLVGLCSGGRHALEVAPLVGARTVVAINSALHIPRSALNRIAPTNPYPAEVAQFDRQPVRWRLRSMVPAVLGRSWCRRGHGAPGAGLLTGLQALGIDVVLAYGDGEFNLMVARRSCSWLLTDLNRQPGSGLLVIDGLDHALMGSVPRRALAEALNQHLAVSFGSLMPELPLALPDPGPAGHRTDEMAAGSDAAG